VLNIWEFELHMDAKCPGSHIAEIYIGHNLIYKLLRGPYYILRVTNLAMVHNSEVISGICQVVEFVTG
jgi:hypothetical protein